MTNATRLSILIRLRKQKKLSQKDMAQYCDLMGRQSRKTVGQWELGEIVPERRHAAKFREYLLHGLELRTDLPKFQEIWGILVEEWGWAPITEEEVEALRKPQDDLIAPAQVELEPNKEIQSSDHSLSDDEHLVDDNGKETQSADVEDGQGNIRQKGSISIWLIGILCISVLTVLSLWLYIANRARSSISATYKPIFVEDFARATLDPDKWDLKDADYGTIGEGHMVFDAPKNVTTDWQHYDLIPKLIDGTYVERVNFDVMLYPMPNQEPGFLGIEMDCNGTTGRITVYVGGTPLQLLIEYTPDENQIPTKLDTPTTLLAGKIYNVDLTWGKESVDIRLDGHKQGETLPCKPERYLNVNVGLNPGQSLKGSLDNFQIWGSRER